MSLKNRAVLQGFAGSPCAEFSNGGAIPASRRTANNPLLQPYMSSGGRQSVFISSVTSGFAD
jgi:hypothetical protein